MSDEEHDPHMEVEEDTDTVAFTSKNMVKKQTPSKQRIKTPISKKGFKIRHQPDNKR
jgi:hypothetical protein